MRTTSDTSSKTTTTSIGAWVRSVGAVVFWLVVWQLASAIVAKPLILAGPIETVAALVRDVTAPHFWAAIGFSFARIAVGFVLGFVLAVVLGVASSSHTWLRELLSPLMVTLRSAPVVCLVVLLLIWLGAYNVGAAAVFLVVCPAVWEATYQACQKMDEGLVELFFVHSVRGLRRTLGLVWPQLVPALLGVASTVVGMSWKAGVAAELIGIPYGSIGERIYQSKLLLETADLFAWTFVIIAISAVCERLFVMALRSSGTASLRLAVRLSASAQGRGAKPAAVSFDRVGLIRGDTTVLDGLSATLSTGSRTCLRDASGRGKTSLLGLVSGMLYPTSGEVSHGTVSMVFQQTRLVEQLDAHDNVVLIGGSDTTPADVDSLLGRVLSPELLDRPVSQLSGGQRRRVELVRALAVDASTVLLDEPFTGLDDDARAVAASMVVDALDGRTLIVASHDETDASLLGARQATIDTLS